MSILVSVEELPATLAGFGPGYLLSTSADGSGRVKIVSVLPRWADGSLVLTAPGPGTLRNLVQNAVVSLVFPPAEPTEHSLIVDGEAEAVGDDVRVRPTGAVLHRSAAAPD